MNKDYYKILGVARTAKDAAIKKAYRNIAKKYHPDKNPGDKEAEERFKEASEAHDILSDPFKRNQYDRFGRILRPEEKSDFKVRHGNNVVFNFGNFNFRQSYEQQVPPVKIKVLITIAESLNGRNGLNVKFHRMGKCESCSGKGYENKGSTKPCIVCNGTGQINMGGVSFLTHQCDACNGTGEVITLPCKQCDGRKVSAEEKNIRIDIPPGALDNNVMTIHGVGNYNPYNSQFGDLHVFIEVLNEKYIYADGPDLKMKIPVTIKEAIFGCDKVIPNPHGNIKIKIPKGIRSNSILKVSEKGLRRGINLDSFGHLYLTIIIDIPEVADENFDKMKEEFDDSEFIYDEVEEFNRFVKTNGSAKN